MKKIVWILPILLAFSNISNGLETFHQKIIVNSSELTIIPVTPNSFRWEKRPGSVKEIEYSARIFEFPDLPHWLHYTYEGFNSIGFLYGAPPASLTSISLDVVGLNRDADYDVRRLLLSMDVLKKNPLEFIIELKIDNLNDRDLCNSRRMGLLLNIFKEHLFWEKSDGNLVQPVYMSSAKLLGESKEHLRPNEPEGVVIHLASDKDFSSELKKLQSEISPLWKLRPCPRDMKRTSMERHFRRQNFLIDWCSFRLSTTHHWVRNGNNDIEHASSVEEDSTEKETGEQEPFHFRSEIPERTYGVEILIATVIPGTIGGFVGFILIVLLWADKDESEPIFKQENGNHYLYKGGVPDEGFIVLTRDKHFEKENIERDVSTPLPPQYGEIHPNGAPALTYAV